MDRKLQNNPDLVCLFQVISHSNSVSYALVDRYGLEPVLGPEPTCGIDIGSWSNPVLNGVTEDFPLIDDTIFGIFMQE